MVSRKNFIPVTYQSALEKCRKYCAYQERSQQEVRNKLFESGLKTSDVEQVIVDLIQEGFINEERFAIAFAGGKFRMKQWGRLKIKSALKAKMISEYCIRKALDQIDSREYLNALKSVMAKRTSLIKESHPLKRKNNVARYAISHGFEPGLVWDVLNDNTHE